MREKTKRLRALWIPVVLFAGAIFLISAVSDIGTGPGKGRDKIVHALEYAPFGFLIMRAIGGTWGKSRRTAGSSILLAALYGVSDELHQSFVPGRSCDYRDWIADLVGASVGVLIYWIWAAKKEHDTGG